MTPIYNQDLPAVRRRRSSPSPSLPLSASGGDGRVQRAKHALQHAEKRLRKERAEFYTKLAWGVLAAAIPLVSILILAWRCS